MMDEREIDKGQVSMAFAEIGAIKLVLSAMLKGGLPLEARESNAEIEGLIKLVRKMAFRAKVEGATREGSDVIMRIAEEQAVRFLQLHVRKIDKSN